MPWFSHSVSSLKAVTHRAASQSSASHRAIVELSAQFGKGLHGSKNLYPKRPVNTLNRTDLDPYFI